VTLERVVLHVALGAQHLEARDSARG
jgi:hypothetical protein